MQNAIYFVITYLFIFNTSYAENTNAEHFSVSQICQEKNPEQIAALINKAVGIKLNNEDNVTSTVMIDQNSVISAVIPAYSLTNTDNKMTAKVDEILFKIDCKQKRISLLMPYFSIEHGGKSKIKANGFSFNAEYAIINNKAILNDIELAMAHFTAQLFETPKTNYKIENLNYSSKLIGNSDHRKFTIDASLKKLVHNGYSIGPIVVNLEVNKWPISIFSNLSECITSEINNNCTNIFFSEINEYFTTNTPTPVLLINKFSAKTQDGEIKISGYYARKNESSEKKNGDLMVAIPKKTLVYLAMEGCKVKLRELDPTVTPSDMQYLCNEFTKGQLKKYKRDKLYTEKSGIWTMRLEFNGEKILSNGREIGSSDKDQSPQ